MQAAQSSTGWSIAKAQSSAFTFAAAQVGVSPGEDVHAVASLLKWYLASLPNSLLDDKLFDRWVFYSCLPLLLGMPRRCPVAANLCQLSFTRCATTTNVEMACRSLPLQQTNQPTNQCRSRWCTPEHRSPSSSSSDSSRPRTSTCSSGSPPPPRPSPFSRTLMQHTPCGLAPIQLTAVPAVRCSEARTG